MAEAQILLENGKSGQAQQMVNIFVKGSGDLMLELKKQDLLRVDASRVTDVEQAMADQIDLQKSLMSEIGSTSPIYPIKEKLLNLEVELADTPEEKKVVMAEQVLEKTNIDKTDNQSSVYGRSSDWKIIREEIVKGAKVIKTYQGGNLSKVGDTVSLVRDKTLNLINNYKK